MDQRNGENNDDKPGEVFKKGFYYHLEESYPKILKMLTYASKNPKVGWRHIDFPSAILVFCNDAEKCRKGNDPSNKENVAYAYYNQETVDIINENWDSQRILEVSLAMDNWEPFKHVSHDLKRWSIDIAARVASGLPFIPLDQNVIGAKWFLSTFLTDDPLEKAMLREEWWSTGKAFLERFNSIYDGKGGVKESLSMAGAEGTTPANVIQGMNLALKIHQKELEPEMRRILHPAAYQTACVWAREYAEGIEKEAKLFGIGLREGKFVDMYSIDATRIYTIGYFWIVPPLVHDPDFFKYITSGADPLSMKISWICAQDNDIASGPKDQKIDGRDFSPISKVNYLMEEAKKKGETLDFLSALRQAAQFSNECKLEVEQEIAEMEPERRKHYVWQYQLLHKLFDYHFVASISRPNYRYGWEPFLL